MTDATNDNADFTTLLQRSIATFQIDFAQQLVTAQTMRRDAELRFDGPISAEFLTAIAEQERADNLAAPAPRVIPTFRQLAAMHWLLAKEMFVPVIRNAYGPRGTAQADRFWKQQRRLARPHVEAWAAFRRAERLAEAA